MKEIRAISHQIKEEISDAKNYAKLAVHYKQEQSTLSKTYYDLANDELRHAEMLHSEAVKLIEKQRSIQTPPAVMLELWEYEHTEFIEDYGTAKNMISLYSK